MKKILFLSNDNDILTNGGIQTFARTLGGFFKDKILFLQFLENKKKHIHKKNDLNIKSIYSESFIMKLLNKLSKQKFKIKKMTKEIKKIIINQNIDSIIISSPQEIKYISKFNGKKILVQHTSIDNLVKSKNYYNDEVKLIKRIQEELDYFIALSEYDVYKIQKELSISKRKIKVIRHSSIVPMNKTIKKKKKSLIMISRLSKEKRIDLAIEAMEKLKTFNLKIYGNGSEEKMLKNLVLEKKLTNVQFHGPTNRVVEKLDENGIFIMTSDFEGYPMGAIEALRRGLPIILRKTFDSSEDIVQGNGVLLEKEWDAIKFAKAVEDCYENYDVYSLKSLELGKRHNEDIIKKQWELILNEDINLE